MNNTRFTGYGRGVAHPRLAKYAILGCSTAAVPAADGLEWATPLPYPHIGVRIVFLNSNKYFSYPEFRLIRLKTSLNTF